MKKRNTQWCGLLVLGSTWFFIACSVTPSAIPNEVAVIAHGGGAAYWIRNSRNAVEKLVDVWLDPQAGAEFDGLEVDIVLTADDVPVLSHDPWIHTDLCESEQREITQELLIANLTANQVRSEFLCGGLPDSEFPDAELKSESILDFAEFLAIVQRAPDLQIYLDLKIQPPLTKTAQHYAAAILDYWRQSKLPNKLIIEVPTQAASREFREHGVGDEFSIVLSYPAYYAGENWTLVGIGSALRTYWNPQRPVNEAGAARADAIASLPMLLPVKAVEHLRHAGIGVVAFTAASSDELRRHCRSGASIVITDVPLAGGCQ